MSYSDNFLKVSRGVFALVVCAFALVGLHEIAKECLIPFHCSSIGASIAAVIYFILLSNMAISGTISGLIELFYIIFLHGFKGRLEKNERKQI